MVYDDCMTKTTTEKQERKAAAIESLREDLPPGSTAKTILRHVARSGMTRWISVIVDGEDRTWQVARALGENYGGDTKHDGIRVGGCGMDAGFELVYNLSRTLYPDGYACIGGWDDEPETTEFGRCPANDHVNRGDTHLRWHRDGGYAVSQRWL